MLRLSNFTKWISWFIINIIIIIICFHITIDIHDFGIWNIPVGVGRVFGIMFLATSSMVFYSFYYNTVALRYKIVKDKYIYKAKVLHFWWLFIPNWYSVETRSHSYDSTNIFGAPTIEYYSSEVTYKIEQEALDAIDRYKLSVIKNRKALFMRSDKKSKTTKYI